MKTALLLTFLLLSANSFADYTCYPTKRNTFAKEVVQMKILKQKVRITETDNEFFRIGEAKLQGSVKADGKHFKYDTYQFSSLERVKDNYPPPSSRDWFGEGHGEVMIEDVLVNKGADRGRMAIAWCYHWCTYNYFSCTKN